MKRSALAVLLLLAHLSGCAAGVQAPPSDITIPADARVVPPADTTPKALAAFSGTWSGAWYGEKTGTYMADQIIIVESIFPPSSAQVTYAGVGRWGQLNGQPWLYRVDGTFTNNDLVLTLPGGIDVTLHMNRNGTLDATATGRGGTWRGTFVRTGK